MCKIFQELILIPCFTRCWFCSMDDLPRKGAQKSHNSSWSYGRMIPRSVLWLGYGVDVIRIVVRLLPEARDLSSQGSRPAMGPKQPPIQLTPAAFTQGKAARAWIWQITSTGVEVKKEWSYTSTSRICHHGVHRDKFSDCTFNTSEFFPASIRGFHTILRIKRD
jgi:hypothetical protein